MFGTERLGWQVRITIVQTRHQLEVEDECAQLGRGTQIQLHAIVQVERAIQGVDVRSNAIHALRLLEQEEGVVHAGRVAATQETGREKTGGCHESRIAHLLEDLRCLGLKAGVDRGGDGQVQAIEFIQVSYAEQRDEVPSHRARRIGGVGPRAARLLVRSEAQRRSESGVAEFGVNHSGGSEATERAIGRGSKGRMIVKEVVARSPQTDEQAHDLFEELAPAGWLIRGAAFQQRVCRGEVDAVPGPHPVSQPEDLAEARGAGERDRVQVVECDLAPGRRGVCSAGVGLQGRRGHLPQLLADGRRASSGRVPVLGDLRR